jgi:hypothetical protein
VFDTTPQRRDLWLLLLIFLADRPLAELTETEFYADGYEQHLLGLNSDFTEDEITRILLSSAIALRVIDDRDGGILDKLDACGELQPDSSSPGAEPLSMREACNKIVHATKVNYDVERLDGGPVKEHGISPPYMRPTVYLYGSQRKVTWRCALDVIQFVRGASIVL